MTDAIAFIDGRPVVAALLEDRLAKLRRGTGRGLLPSDGSAQFRQLRRWIAQVLIVETLCQQTSPDDGTDDPELDAAAAADLGSIVAAAYQANPGVRAAYRRLGSTLRDPKPEGATPLPHTPQFRLRQALRRNPQHPMPPLREMGWVCPGDIPEAMGKALPNAEPGRLIGPVRSSLGEHLFVVDDVRDRPSTDATRAHANESDRRRMFLDWLARQRRDRVVEVAGYEHPADPRQPDHQHRH